MITWQGFDQVPSAARPVHPPTIYVFKRSSDSDPVTPGPRLFEVSGTGKLYQRQLAATGGIGSRWEEIPTAPGISLRQLIHISPNGRRIYAAGTLNGYSILCKFAATTGTGWAFSWATCSDTITDFAVGFDVAGRDVFALLNSTQAIKVASMVSAASIRPLNWTEVLSRGNIYGEYLNIYMPHNNAADTEAVLYVTVMNHNTPRTAGYYRVFYGERAGILPVSMMYGRPLSPYTLDAANIAEITAPRPQAGHAIRKTPYVLENGGLYWGSPNFDEEPIFIGQIPDGPLLGKGRPGVGTYIHAPAGRTSVGINQLFVIDADGRLCHGYHSEEANITGRCQLVSNTFGVRDPVPFISQPGVAIADNTAYVAAYSRWDSSIHVAHIPANDLLQYGGAREIR